MRKTLRLIPMALALLCSAVFMPLQAAGDYASKMKLWYSSPSKITEKEVRGEYTSWFTTKYDGATKWMEYALPIGNGQLGATFTGNIDAEYLQFNEKTLWSGTSSDYNFGASSSYSYGAYQNFGHLTISTGHSSSSYSNYNRELDLTTATGRINYTSSNVEYTREFIASYPHKVVAARFSANQNQKVNLTISLTKGRGLSSGSVSYSNATIDLSGSLNTISYDAQVKVINKGGSLTTNSGNITVSGANEVIILLAAGTNYDPMQTSYVSGSLGNVKSTMQERIAQAEALGWDALYSAHVEDYKELFGRVEFDLEGSSNTTQTQTLVSGYSASTSSNDLMLDQLYFAYGRYLGIASSRGVSLPSNLQGIWNNVDVPKWNADIHANINVQMNYWASESTNLSETHEPFLKYIINMSKSAQWKKYAQDNGQSRGWTTFTENNIFGGVGYWMHNYVVENAWFASHLWQHYLYTMDKTFLEEAFPAMLGATQFWIDRMIKDTDGTWVCPNEYSPEHGPKSEDGVAHAQQLVYELFENTLQAIEVLGKAQSGISDDDYTKLQDRFQNMDKGLATETYNGSTKNNVTKGSVLLREWKKTNYNGTDVTLEHRHLSHLMCLYPFNQVSETSPFFQAAKNSLQLRGDAATGWAMGWKINLWARALDGDHAHTILKSALTHTSTYSQNESKGGVYYNLWSSHAPFQIDGNFGATSGITEMLFQSHSGILHIMPAMPSQWKNGGSVKGLKGRGNFTVDFTWTSNTTPTSATIISHKGQPCQVKCKNIDLTTVCVTVNGNGVTPQAKGNGVYAIPSSTEGDVIAIDFTRGPIVEETVGTPTFSPNGGEVQEGATVTISCATEGAKIYYTTNGTTPTTASTLYSGAIAVNQGMTLKAIAVKDGYTNSAVAQATFTIKAKEVVATPAFSISGGEVEEGTQVTISCATSGATVYYTTDGSAPSTSSAKYTGAITVSKAMTIKAIAVKDGYYTNSQVASATFTIKGKEVVATPAISPNGGEYESSATVTLTCATEGATIYYTTDGSTPTTTSAIYSKPFTLTESATVKAMAAKSGYYTNSAVSSAVFTITQPAPEPEPEPEPEEPTNACGDYLTWEYAGGVLTISGEGDMYDFDSAQDAPWASVASQVTSIVLPDEITRIGNNAFAGCSGVASLTFDDNDCVFGTNAFNTNTKTYLVIDDTEKKNFAMHANKYYQVTIKRKLSSTNYGTIIMPFAPSTTTKNSFKFYQLRNIMGSYIYYSRVYGPSANVPYLYKNSSSSSSKWASEIVSSNNVTIKATEKPSVSSGNWTTVGSYKNMYITDQDSLSYHYAMSNNSLMNFNQSLSIYPLRAYFEGPVYDSNARQMQLVILDDEETTSIYIVQGDEQEETNAYDLQGRRVNKLVPGQMYIINGEKVLFER